MHPLVINPVFSEVAQKALWRVLKRSKPIRLSFPVHGKENACMGLLEAFLMVSWIGLDTPSHKATKIPMKSINIRVFLSGIAGVELPLNLDFSRGKAVFNRT